MIKLLIETLYILSYVENSGFFPAGAFRNHHWPRMRFVNSRKRDSCAVLGNVIRRGSYLEMGLVGLGLGIDCLMGVQGTAAAFLCLCLPLLWMDWSLKVESLTYINSYQLSLCLVTIKTCSLCSDCFKQINSSSHGCGCCERNQSGCSWGDLHIARCGKDTSPQGGLSCLHT